MIAGVTAFGPGLQAARAYAVGLRPGLGKGMAEAVALAGAAVAGLALLRLAVPLPLLAGLPDVALVALLAAAMAVQLVANHGLMGAERFELLAVTRTAGSLVGAAAMVGGGIAAGPRGAVAGLAVGQGTLALASVLALGRAGPHHAAADAAVPMPGAQRTDTVLAALLGPPVFWLGQSLVAAGPDGAAQVGHISAVQPFVQAALFLPAQLTLAVFARLTRDADLRPTLRTAMRGTALAGLAPALLLAATSPWWPVVLGASYQGLPMVAVPLLAAAGLQGTMGPAVRALEARGGIRVTVALNALAAVVVVGGTMALGARGFPGGAAYGHAMLAAFAMHSALLGLAVRRLVRG